MPDNEYALDGARFKAAAEALVAAFDGVDLGEAEKILDSPRWEESTLCPRCEVIREPQFAALSRVTPPEYICNHCGDHEAMLDILGDHLPTPDEWPVEVPE